MGTTKKHIFTEGQNRMSQMAKAMAHPARIAIIQHILREGGCVCGDLVNTIGLSQPTISQHLKEMRSAGLIVGTIEGKRTCYALDKTTTQELGDFIQTLVVAACNKFDCC